MPKTIQVFDTQLQSTESAVHLGHRLYADGRKDSTEDIVAAFYRQLNGLRCKFKGVASHIQDELFKVHCSSFYGFILLPIRKYEKLSVVWRKSMRQIWRLPYRCHNRIMACLSGKLCCRHMLTLRFLTFARSAIHHSSGLISSVLRRAVQGRRSVFSNNLEECCHELRISTDDFMKRSQLDLRFDVARLCDSCKSAEDIATSLAIRDLCDMRDGATESYLPMHQTEELIEALCLS